VILCTFLQQHYSSEILYGCKFCTIKHRNFRSSKSYLTPPRWTPVFHHITTHLRKVDENVNPAKFRRLCSAFLHFGLGVPCWCGWVGPGRGVGPASLLVHVLGKYLDPAGLDRGIGVAVALRTRHMGNWGY